MLHHTVMLTSAAYEHDFMGSVITFPFAT